MPNCPIKTSKFSKSWRESEFFRIARLKEGSELPRLDISNLI